MLQRIKKYRALALVCGALGVVAVATALYRSGSDETLSPASIGVYTVSRGDVSTGIRVSGKVSAARVLDLNVYKLGYRIDEVSVANGAYVNSGDTLVSFDASDAMVAVAQSRLTLSEAQLAEDTKRKAAVDPNTTIATLRNDIVALEKSLAQYGTDKEQARRTFYNADLTAEPTPTRFKEQIVRTAPTIGGLYTHEAQGEYVITVYRSSADSGYSYNFRGLESGVASVYLGTEAPLGTRGLKITFPSDLAVRDEWVVAVPNTAAPEYRANKEQYEETLTTIEKSIAADTVALANKKVQLAQAEREDSEAQRELTVSDASLAVRKAWVDLEQANETAGERVIRAPFSGTVEGMENVVPGATPTRDTNDPIDLGSLISDTFLVTFSLGAGDIDRVAIGQTVEVTLTSVPESEPLRATVVEKSSLPGSGTVAEYEVRAELSTSTVSGVTLREGMLADVLIVAEETRDTLRVPTQAITYTEGRPSVLVLTNLTEEQQRRAARGILSDDGTLQTSVRQITLGLRGAYYVEVREGLSEGEYLKVTSVSGQAEQNQSSVRTGFGGMRPPSGSSGSPASSQTGTRAN